MNGHELTRMTSSAMTRREMLGLVASAAPLLAAAPSLLGAEDTKRKRLGVCTYSYNLHWKAAREGNPKARFQNPIEFLEYCHQLGAGGVQVGIGRRDADYATRLRTRAEALDRKSTRLNSSHSQISYAVFCLKKKKKTQQ